MTSNTAISYPPSIIEIRDNGFAPSSRGIQEALRHHPYLKRYISNFKYRSTRKFSSLDVFGVKNLNIYYDLDQKDKICEHLLSLFLAKNPTPNRGLKTVFSVSLHEHNLHLNPEQLVLLNPVRSSEE